MLVLLQCTPLRKCLSLLCMQRETPLSNPYSTFTVQSALFETPNTPFPDYIADGSVEISSLMHNQNIQFAAVDNKK